MSWAAKDVARYLSGYPGKKDDLAANLNLRFYKNEIQSYPQGDYIDEIHKDWFGHYELLEGHHGYIQWLFPIREKGMNSYSQELQLFEAKAIAEDPKLTKRLIKSYRLMLDFYGMELACETTGLVRRKKNESWKECYCNLEERSHNWLRITRILKCLGEMNLEHYKKPLLAHMISERHTGYLRACGRSLANYWIPVVRSADERDELAQYFLDKTKPVSVAPEPEKKTGEEKDMATERGGHQKAQTKLEDGKSVSKEKTTIATTTDQPSSASGIDGGGQPQKMAEAKIVVSETETAATAVTNDQTSNASGIDGRGQLQNMTGDKIGKQSKITGFFAKKP